MGLLRSNKTEARKLSSDLREDDSGSVRRRRAVVGLSLLGSASLGVIALYQMGIIKHLPEPKLPYLDADKVDASPEAYEWLSTPDAILGVAGYGTSMILAAMGGKHRVKKQPYIPLALAAKTVLDVFNAGRLTREQWTKHRAFCIWCLVAAASTFVTVPFVLPEAAEAIRHLRSGASKSAQKGGIAMPNEIVIAFDLVGTLLDLSALDPTFRAEFGDSRVRQEWFAEVQKLMFSITAAGGYESFPDIAEAALKVIEQRHQNELSPARRKQILQSLRQLPAFPDVKPALQRLQAGGFRLVVLTNSGERDAKQAMESASLTSFFEDLLSAESVKRLKPAPELYRMATKECHVKAKDLLLVAGHSWDIAGAKRAGCRTCFVQRPEQVLDSLTPKPDLVVSDLEQLANRLVETKKAA